MDWLLELAAEFECFLSVLGCQDGVPFCREHQPDQIPNHGLIFGKQYDGFPGFHKHESSFIYLISTICRATRKGGEVARRLPGRVNLVPAGRSMPYEVH